MNGILPGGTPQAGNSAGREQRVHQAWGKEYLEESQGGMAEGEGLSPHTRV